MLTIEKGFVYILSNKEYTGKYKIGRSKENPIIRAKTLSKQTGALGEFKPEWSKEVPDMNIAELILHYKLSKYHYDKEFFEYDLEKLKKEGEKVLDEFFKEEYELEELEELEEKVKARIIEIEKIDLEQEFKKLK